MGDNVTLRTGKHTVWVVLLATVVALALVVALGASANKASAATKLVTKSFSNTSLIHHPRGRPRALPLGAALPYPSNITASFPTGSKVKRR